MKLRNLLLQAALVGSICITGAAAHSAEDASTVISTLQSPGSSVIIVADPVLLERAMPQQVTKADETAPDEDETTAQPEQEKTVKSRSGKTAGYRVQVFADNNARTAKGEARARERSVMMAFPQYPTYVAYSSPYWRLRVGDFKSQAEADKAAAEIRRAFPAYAKEVRVVRDHINAR